MKQQAKFRGFTLYFQETPDDERWIAAFGDLLRLAPRFAKVEWRLKHPRNVNKAFLDIYRSGIYIDTIESPLVAVFLDDWVEVETVGRNKKTKTRTIKSWGFGGKTPAQLKRKLVSMLVRVLDAWDWWEFPDPECKIEHAAIVGLLGFMVSQDPRYLEPFWIVSRGDAKTSGGENEKSSREGAEPRRG